jgi:hypothetical protein
MEKNVYHFSAACDALFLLIAASTSFPFLDPVFRGFVDHHARFDVNDLADRSHFRSSL